ncbi:hypothetical protein [Nostoc sp. LEGE 12447]|nr:hypothetical protein [Nostoc sp. LEGE 12447]
MTNPVVESRRTALSGKKSIYDSAFLPPVIPSNKIKFAFNATGRNKDWDFKKLAANFQDTEGTLEDVQQHIKAGHAICAGLLGGKWRSKANVIGSQ